MSDFGHVMVSLTVGFHLLSAGAAMGSMFGVVVANPTVHPIMAAASVEARNAMGLALKTTQNTHHNKAPRHAAPRRAAIAASAEGAQEFLCNMATILWNSPSTPESLEKGYRVFSRR